ncbi:MAG: hypothetical protein V4685_06315 [Bacteroidota bacterium]
MVTLFNVPAKRILVVVLVVLMGCKDSDKNSSLIFEELNESLEQSNKLIHNSSNDIFMDLENKAHKLTTAENAAKWFPVADTIYSKAEYLIRFIDSLVSNFNQNKIRIGPLTSSDLHNKLMVFREFVLNDNAYLKLEYKEAAKILGKETKDSSEFYKVNFLDEDKARTITSLLKIKNDILVATNKVVAFCNNQVGYLDGPGYFESFSAIAAANSTRLGANEEMIITAGVAQFSKISKPSFVINGKVIQPNENGVGEYKMKVNNKPGKYKVHVKISFISENAKPTMLEKDIEYTVVE